MHTKVGNLIHSCMFKDGIHVHNSCVCTVCEMRCAIQLGLS